MCRDAFLLGGRKKRLSKTSRKQFSFTLKAYAKKDTKSRSRVVIPHTSTSPHDGSPQDFTSRFVGLTSFITASCVKKGRLTRKNYLIWLQPLLSIVNDIGAPLLLPK